MSDEASKRAFIYCRVSTPRQAEKGLSISVNENAGIQETECRNYAERHKMKVAGVYCDAGITGRSTGLRRRLGLMRCLRDVKRAKGTLVVYSLSRFGRSAKDILNMAGDLRDAGVTLVSVKEDGFDTSTPYGRMLFTIFAAFAELESEVLGERMRDAHAHRRRKDGRAMNSQPPAGWRVSDGGGYEKDPEEQEIIRLVRSIRWQNRFCKYPSDRTAQELKRRGVKTIRTLRNERRGLVRPPVEWSGGIVNRCLWPTRYDRLRLEKSAIRNAKERVRYDIRNAQRRKQKIEELVAANVGDT